jgi:Protein of unknown function (DUF3301)
MQLTWGTLVFVLACALVVWFWRDSLLVRDRANTAAIEACTRLALQFLDGTVAFSKLRFVRDAGQLKLRRTYVFDYTAHSIERLQGFVVLLGTRVESVGFARDANSVSRPISDSRPVFAARAPIQEGELLERKVVSSDTLTRSEPGKVLDLSEWRRDREQRH